jgi:hypothetical protein
VGAGGLALHHHGGTWSPTPTGTTQVIWSAWSQGPSEAWAVGNGGTVLRWSGAAWTR